MYSCVYYYYYLRVLHISVCWSFSTGIWVTASLLKSPAFNWYHRYFHVPGTAKSTIRHVIFFCWLSLAEITWSGCVSKPQRTLCVSFSRTDSGLCIYHLFAWSNLNFLHSYLWITLYYYYYHYYFTSREFLIPAFADGLSLESEWQQISRTLHSVLNRDNPHYMDGLDSSSDFQFFPFCAVAWGCRIHRLHLCRGVKKNPPRYDTKKSDGEALVMLHLWGMGSIPSLPLLPDPL